MSNEKVKTINVELNPTLYHEMLMMKKNRTWSEFFRDELVLKKSMVNAIKSFNGIKTAELYKVKQEPTLKVPCEICQNKYPMDELQETKYSHKFLCNDCWNKLYQKEQRL